MLAYVDIEQKWRLHDPMKGPPHQEEADFRSRNICDAIGIRCKPVHYLDFSIEWMRANDVRAFFISGSVTDWIDYDWDGFKPLQDAILCGDYPVLGCCGGHQLLGMTFGAACDAIGPLEPGEVDLMPSYHPGMRKEKGWLPLQMLDPDHPLFCGFPRTGPVVMESHYWELKETPENFDLLATTDVCTVQVIQHREFPVYGTQGHPEAYTAQYPDGKKFIYNFAVATGLIKA